MVRVSFMPAERNFKITYLSKKNKNSIDERLQRMQCVRHCTTRQFLSSTKVRNIDYLLPSIAFSLLRATHRRASKHKTTQVTSENFMREPQPPFCGSRAAVASFFFWSSSEGPSALPWWPICHTHRTLNAALIFSSLPLLLYACWQVCGIFYF